MQGVGGSNRSVHGPSSCGIPAEVAQVKAAWCKEMGGCRGCCTHAPMCVGKVGSCSCCLIWVLQKSTQMLGIPEGTCL
jgi:hypothetical protein